MKKNSPGNNNKYQQDLSDFKSQFLNVANTNANLNKGDINIKYETFLFAEARSAELSY